MLRELNTGLYHWFDYVPKSTRVDSPIEDALRERKGVCQDFAHVMLAHTRFGVYAQVIYGPPLPLSFQDQELRVACLRAYNSWLAEFCAAAAKIVSRQGPMASTICESCAKACDICGAACEKFPKDEHMTRCAKECRLCAKACRDMLKHAGQAGAE